MTRCVDCQERRAVVKGLCKRCYGRRRYSGPNRAAMLERRRRSRGAGARRGTADYAAMRREFWIDANGQPYWTQERIIRCIRRFAEKHGRAPTAHEWSRGRRRYRRKSGSTLAANRRSDRPSLQTVFNVFGSWNAALVAAGYPPRPRSRGPRVTRKPRTRCNRGHALNAENTYVDPKTGHRKCRICRAAYMRRYERQHPTNERKAK